MTYLEYLPSLETAYHIHLPIFARRLLVFKDGKIPPFLKARMSKLQSVIDSHVG
jgi:hypothetical protein